MKKRILATLLMVLLLSVQLTVLPVGASADGTNVITSIDNLYTDDDVMITDTENSGWKTIADQGYKISGNAVGTEISSTSMITKDTDDNVVIKLGTTDTAKIGYVQNNSIKSFTELYQKWEAKIKIAKPEDVDAYVLGYGGPNNEKTCAPSYSFKTTANRGPGILITGGKVMLPTITKNESTKVLTGAYSNMQALDGKNEVTIEGNTWYKIVRYMNFSDIDSDPAQSGYAGINRHRVQIYEIDASGDETLIGDSEPDTSSDEWAWCGSFGPVFNADGTVKNMMSTVGFLAASTTNETNMGNVMIDDVAAYELDAAIKITANPSWGASAETEGAALFANSNTVTTLSTTALDTEGTNGYYSSKADVDPGVSRGYVYDESATNDNKVIHLGNSTGVNNNGIINNAQMWVDNSSIDSTKIQKWETRIKISDTADTTVYVFGYAPYAADTAVKTRVDRIVADNNPNGGCALKIENGKVYSPEYSSRKVYTDTGITIANETWYKIVRYMDISDENKTVGKSKFVIYKDGESTPLYSDAAWKTSHSLTVGTTDGKNIPGVVSTFVTTDAGHVCVDDMRGCYVELSDSNFTIDNGQDLPVEIPDIEAVLEGEFDAGSFDAAKVTLTRAGGAVELDNVVLNGNKITIDLPMLEYDTEYTLKIGRDIVKNAEFKNVAESDITYTFTTMKLLDVSNPVVKSGDTVLSDVPTSGTKITGGATLTNVTDEEASYLIIVACYNGNEFLDAAIKSGKISGTASEGVFVSTDEEFEIPEGCTRISTMVWNDWNSSKPLIPCAEIPAQ